MEVDVKYLAERLIEFRDLAHKSQEDVAKALGMKQSSYSKYETCQIKKPGNLFINKVAKVLERDPSEFYLDNGSDFLPSAVRLWLEKPNCKNYIIKAYSDFYADVSKGIIDDDGNPIIK